MSDRRSPPRPLARVRVVAWPSTLLVVALLVLTATANAQEGGGNCSLSSLTLAFGTINPQANGTVYTSGTATMTCSNLGANATVAACLSIGAGNASGSTSSARVLSVSGSSTHIPIAISSSPSASQQIGNGSSYPQDGPITTTANGSGQATVTFPITVALTGPLAATPATYSNTFSGSNFRATYRSPAVASCSQTNNNASGGQMIVQAVVVAGCTATATALNFGSTSILSGTLTASSTIRLTCTSGVTAVLSLDYGQTGSSPTNRLMKSGAFSIQYGIYQDSARTIAWGQTTGVNTLSLVVAGTTATATAYGAVPAQMTPPAATYTDVVNVNVNY